MKKLEFISAVLGWPLLIIAFLLMAIVLGFLRMTTDLGLENVIDAFARLLGVE